MIAEALKFITDLKAASLAPQVINTQDPTHSVLMVGTQIHDTLVPPPPRKHTADDIDTIIALVQRFADDAYDPVIWVGSGANW